MPNLQSLTAWLAINACNDTSASGVTDRTTGQTQYVGDLDGGVYVDLTESEANQASYTATGLLHVGRYKRVQVDSGATASNVKTGTMAFLAPTYGSGIVQGVTILTAGSGQTPGTYNVAANSTGGGGSGAIIQVNISAAGTLTSAVVIQGGSNYRAVPTFTLATGGTVGTVQAQLALYPSVVTTQDLALGLSSGISPFYAGVFLNVVTPGNWCFIQEIGIASLLSLTASFVGTGAVGSPVLTKTGGGGTVDCQSVNTALTPVMFGYAIDTPTNGGIIFRAKLNLFPAQQ